MSKREKVRKCFQEKTANRQFAILGGVIGRRPFYFLVFPMIISILLSTGTLFMHAERDQDWLYTDINGKAATNKRLVDKLFPLNTSENLEISRITSIPDITMMILTAKDGGSMLQENVIKEVVMVDRVVSSVKVNWKENSVNYSILCAKAFNACLPNHLPEIVSNYEGIKTGKYKIKYPVSIDELTHYYKEYITFLGGVKLDDSGFVKDIAALKFLHVLDFSDNSKLEAIKEWQSLIDEYITNSNFDYIDAVSTNKRSLYKSSEALTLEILEMLPYVVGTIILFSALTCMSDQWLTSKPIVGMCGCMSAIFAIGSGLGLGFAVGLPYLDPYPAIMYVILVIEIDDGFMLIASWRNTNPEDTVPKRMERTFYDTAPSITITSLTNIISCCVGITSTVPSFRLICLMAALCSLFAYVYQITFFGACLALSGYVEERNRRSITNSKGNTRRPNKTSPMRKKGDIFMLWFQNSIGTLLTHRAAKMVVIFAFLANFATGMWGWTFIKFGMGMNDIFPNSSSVTKAILTNYQYFDKYTFPVHVIIRDTVNYADEKIQSSIESLMEKFESHPNIAKSPLRISWLKYYKSFMKLPVGKMVLSGYNMSDKQDFLDGLRNVFLRFIPAVHFKLDLSFNENYTDIVASRFLLSMKDINSTDTEVRAIQDFYKIASKSELPVEIFGLTFHYLEQAWIVKDIIIQTGCIATALCCVIFLLFSRHFRSSLCVGTIVLCGVCELVGYLSLWGVPVDISAVVVFLISVGLSINHPLHMVFAFVSKNGTHKERINHAIYQTGFPLIQGALSTILGLFVLTYSEITIMKTIYKVIYLIVFLSTFHSLLVIPVLLSMPSLFTKQTSETSASTLKRGESDNGGELDSFM